MNYKIANRLVELRKRNGYSQEELADKLGVSRQAISNWERAEALPDTENLIALAGLYEITLDEVIHGDKPNAVQPIAEQGNKIKPTQGNDMKPVRSAFKMVSVVHFIVGSPLLSVGILLFGLSFAFEGGATLALRITGGALAFSGLVEFILGTCFGAIARNQRKNLERLKSIGSKIQVDAIEVKRVMGIRTGRLVSARLECTYTHHDRTSTAISPIFLTNRNDKNTTYNAFVYMNPQDSSDYAVEGLYQ